MSKISDMYEQIKLQQYTLIKTKLQEAVMARKEKRELSREEKEDYTFTDDEATILIKMLEEQGFIEGKDFGFEEEPFEYNDTVPELHIRIGNDILHFSGMNSVTDIIPMQELEEDVKENPEYYNARLLSLKPIELEKLGLSIDSIQNLSKTTNDIRQQFEESLLRDDVVEYYLSKTPEELEAELGPEVTRMVGFEQKNMHHCYDLWGHTLHTVEAVDTTGLTEEQAKKLKVAAFFHDIGKPDVTGFNPKTEQQTFYNHAVHSVDIAKPILESLGYSESEINQIGFFIGHHDDFINYKPSLDSKQKGHAFFREINPSTVSEIVTQNKYDFDKLGFESYLPTHTESEETNKKNNAINNENKLKIRYICSTLNNNGVEPVFKDFRGNPINISVDIEDVQSKIFSGEYDAQYIPSLEDYQLLLELCKADARAQSEEVKDKSGNIVDSRKRKLETMEKIEQVMPEAYKTVEDRDKFLASILKSATKRVQTREQAKKAKELEHEYDKQLPQNQQSLDDN